MAKPKDKYFKRVILNPLPGRSAYKYGRSAYKYIRSAVPWVPSLWVMTGVSSFLQKAVGTRSVLHSLLPANLMIGWLWADSESPQLTCPDADPPADWEFSFDCIRTSPPWSTHRDGPRPPSLAPMTGVLLSLWPCLRPPWVIYKLARRQKR